MQPPLTIDALYDFAWAHWLSIGLLSATILVFAAVAFLRWWLKRSWQRLIEENVEDLDAFGESAALDERDRPALQLVKDLRREVWDVSPADLDVGFEPLFQKAARVVCSVAAVYHPEAPKPEYEATLLESLLLARRVNTRIIRLTRFGPFRLLAERRLSEYQKAYETYRKFQDSPLVQTLKKHRHLYRVARWAIHLKNIQNPVYWAGRELSREGSVLLLRWFHAHFIQQVGREAIRIYGRRPFLKEEERELTLLLYRLYHLHRHWGGPSSDEWRLWAAFTARAPLLDAEARMSVVDNVANGRLPDAVEAFLPKTRMGIQWYRKGIRKMFEEDPHVSERKRMVLERELAGLGGGSAKSAMGCPAAGASEKDRTSPAGCGS
ncbi:MAG: hypothetical protein SWC40_02780 [Thermodesulfobacteriota bacterium]|nr:hypothetical protein [Thermodesulfobacteriota bacterium]